MKNFFRKKIMPSLYWFFNNEGLSLVVYVLILYFIIKNLQGFQQNMVDLTLFLTLILALLINYSNLFLQNFFSKLFEDRWKLTTKYEELVRKYNSDDYLIIDYMETKASQQDNCKSIYQSANNKQIVMIEEEQKQLAKNYKIFKKNSSFSKKEKGLAQVTFPIMIINPELEGIELHISDDKNKQYELPELIKKQYDHIIGAHNTSQIYNQLNIRVDSWSLNKNKLFMNTSRVTYFDSLVTNRAMDFKWKNGTTTREIFNYGPYIARLGNSQLANILGFYGFIISKDGYIPIVKRNKKVSKGKGMYAPSISASLKVKYALNHRGTFSVDGLENALVKEIEDELKIRKNELVEFKLDKNIITTFRDLIEGGKPELLFYAQSTKTKEEIEMKLHHYTRKKEKRIRKEDIVSKVVENPSKILWIHKDELKSIIIGLEYFVHNNKVYKTLPSYAASLELLRRKLTIIENAHCE